MDGMNLVQAIAMGIFGGLVGGTAMTVLILGIRAAIRAYGFKYWRPKL